MEGIEVPTGRDLRILDPAFKRSRIMKVPGVLDWYDNYILTFPQAPIDSFWCLIHMDSMIASEDSEATSPLPRETLLAVHANSDDLFNFFPDVSDLVEHVLEKIAPVVYCEVNNVPGSFSQDVAWASQALLLRSYETLLLAVDLYRRRSPDYHFLVAASAEASFKAAHLIKEPSSIQDFQRAEAIENYNLTRDFQKMYAESDATGTPDLDSETKKLRSELDKLGVRYSEEGEVFNGQYNQHNIQSLVKSRYGGDTIFSDRPYLLFSHVFRFRNTIAHSLFRSWSLYLEKCNGNLTASSSLKPVFMDSFSLVNLAQIMYVFNSLGRNFGEELPLWFEMMCKVYLNEQISKDPDVTNSTA